jgi:hypothetical protein
LRDPDPEAAGHAAGALAQLGEARALGPLVAALRHWAGWDSADQEPPLPALEGAARSLLERQAPALPEAGLRLALGLPDWVDYRLADGSGRMWLRLDLTALKRAADAELRRRSPPAP